jgi:hypothetical protein
MGIWPPQVVALRAGVVIAEHCRRCERAAPGRAKRIVEVWMGWPGV